MKSHGRGESKTMKAESVEDILKQPDILTLEESIIKFIKKEKQVSYQTLQAHFPRVPETTLRSRMYALTRTGVLKRERCLCGQGWIYEINKK